MDQMLRNENDFNVSLSICTYHTAKEGLKQFEDLKVKFENEYRIKEEKVSGTAHLFTLVASTGSKKNKQKRPNMFYSVLKYLLMFNTCF